MPPEQRVAMVLRYAAMMKPHQIAKVMEVDEVTVKMQQELAEEIKNGLEIRAAKNVKHGFRLAEKDGSGYFDCSDDAIMEMLMPYFRNLEFQ